MSWPKNPKGKALPTLALINNYIEVPFGRHVPRLLNQLSSLNTPRMFTVNKDTGNAFAALLVRPDVLRIQNDTDGMRSFIAFCALILEDPIKASDELDISREHLYIILKKMFIDDSVNTMQRISKTAELMKDFHSQRILLVAPTSDEVQKVWILSRDSAQAIARILAPTGQLKVTPFSNDILVTSSKDEFNPSEFHLKLTKPGPGRLPHPARRTQLLKGFGLLTRGLSYSTSKQQLMHHPQTDVPSRKRRHSSSIISSGKRRPSQFLHPPKRKPIRADLLVVKKPFRGTRKIQKLGDLITTSSTQAVYSNMNVIIANVSTGVFTVTSYCSKAYYEQLNISGIKRVFTVGGYNHHLAFASMTNKDVIVAEQNVDKTPAAYVSRKRHFYVGAKVNVLPIITYTDRRNVCWSKKTLSLFAKFVPTAKIGKDLKPKIYSEPHPRTDRSFIYSGNRRPQDDGLVVFGTFAIGPQDVLITSLDNSVIFENGVLRAFSDNAIDFYYTSSSHCFSVLYEDADNDVESRSFFLRNNTTNSVWVYGKLLAYKKTCRMSSVTKLNIDFLGRDSKYTGTFLPSKAEPEQDTKSIITTTYMSELQKKCPVKRPRLGERFKTRERKVLAVITLD